jgi:hypothetical protein
MKKLRDMLIRIDVAATIIQGRCESLTTASYDKGLDEKEALQEMLAVYNHVMLANTVFVKYLDKFYTNKEKENVTDINSISFDDTEPDMAS